MTLLCTPPGHEKPYDGIAQLSTLVVEEMFRWRDDNAANAEPRPYLPRLDPEVDEALQKFNVHLPSDPYWWDVVDKMYDLGQYNVAMLAQRHAVPTLTDAITASRRPQIRSLLEETSVGMSTESVINAFERMITTSIRELPILSSVTQFDIANSRICSLDLMDVSPQGDDVSDRQTAIMYMLARHVMVRSWWMAKEALAFIPAKYRDYHELRLQEIAESPKRLCYDEFHRTSKSSSVRAQIVRDVREGRKRGVQILLASQLLDDFDKDMVDLATGVWILGSAISDAAVENVRERFGLSDTARNIMRFKLTGPRAGGAPMPVRARLDRRPVRAVPVQHAGAGRAVGAVHLGRGCRHPHAPVPAPRRRAGAADAVAVLPRRQRPIGDQAPHPDEVGKRIRGARRDDQRHHHRNRRGAGREIGTRAAAGGRDADQGRGRVTAESRA